MPQALQRLRLAALNIDGVLLNDTFSPVLHRFVTSRGGEYTADLERRTFSQRRDIAGRELASELGLNLTSDEVLELYFKERAAYLAECPVQLMDGALELLHRVRRLGLSIVCYGGLDRSHFDEFLGDHADLFDGPGYVCTDSFRPGIHEITSEVFGLDYGQAVFIDDVARVAEAAKTLDVPFIGHPSTFEPSFQRRFMLEAGVRHVTDSLDDINDELLFGVDAEAAAGTSWTKRAI